MKCLFGHKWDGCKCSKCGKIRDEGHTWKGCVCSKCGKTVHETRWEDAKLIFTRVAGSGASEVFYAKMRAVCTKCGQTVDEGECALNEMPVQGPCSAYHDGQCAPYGKNSGSKCCWQSVNWQSCPVVGENLRFYKYWDCVAPNNAQNTTDESADSIKAKSRTDDESDFARDVSAAIKSFDDNACVLSFLRENKDERLQSAIVEQLTDQEKITFFALVGVSSDVRCNAVRKLTDQEALDELVDVHFDPEVCSAAARKLPGQAGLDALADIENRQLRLSEAEESSDQARLTELARHYRYYKVREVAAGKLTDQAVLAHIAIHDLNSAVRKVAVARLTDQAALAQIARSDEKFVSIRQAAIERLTDIDILNKIASEDKLTLVQNMARQRLKNLAAPGEQPVCEQNPPAVHFDKIKTESMSDTEPDILCAKDGESLLQEAQFCPIGHEWDGCKCTKCGKNRDEGHDWDLCKGKCRKCGATQPEQHDWDGNSCKRCGKTRKMKLYCNGTSTSIEVTDNNVIISGRVIPIPTILEVRSFPIEQSRRGLGGCIKIVTADNPDLPVRSYKYGFEMPCPKGDPVNLPCVGTDIARGNCYFYTCSYDMDGWMIANQEAKEMKELIESLITTQRKTASQK